MKLSAKACEINAGEVICIFLSRAKQIFSVDCMNILTLTKTYYLQKMGLDAAITTATGMYTYMERITRSTTTVVTVRPARTYVPVN